MFKRIYKILLITFVVGLIGTAVMLPLGVRDTMKRVKTLLASYEIVPERITFAPSVKTVGFDWGYYGDLLLRQAPGDTCYVEIYNGNVIRHSALNVTYTGEDRVDLSFERVFGENMLDEERVSRTIVKELENYPDAVLYVPKTMRLDMEYGYWMNENIEFANKEEMLLELEEKRKQEEAERLAEEQREQEEIKRLEEEQRAQEEAERQAEEQRAQEEAERQAEEQRAQEEAERQENGNTEQ